MSSSTQYGSVNIPLPEGARRELLAHDPQYTLVRICLAKGVESSPHQHPHAQVVYLLEGHGTLDIGDRCVKLNAGDCVSVEPNIPHAFQPPESEIVFLEFFVPGREDIVQ